MSVADVEELARWRGNVEARMHAFEGTVTELKTDLREIRASTTHNGELLAQLVKKNGHGVTPPEPSGKEAVTFKWLMEKIALPLLLAINGVILAILAGHIK